MLVGIYIFHIYYCILGFNDTQMYLQFMKNTSYDMEKLKNTKTLSNRVISHLLIIYFKLFV